MKQRYQYVLWALAGIWVIAMLALSPRFVSLHRETKAVRGVLGDFAGTLTSHQFETAYQFCGADFRTLTSFEQFVKLLRDLESRYGNLKSIKEAGYHVESQGSPAYWRAVFSADFEYQTRTLRFQLEFHKEAGRWVIFSFRQI